MEQITRTNDTQRATLILDLDTHRAIIYKVGREWRVRLGSRQSGLIAPTEFCHECFCGFSGEYATRKAAIAEAEHWLREFRHLGEDEV